VLKPQAAQEWLDSPNPLLGDRRPVDLLAEGHQRVVLGAVDALAEGIQV
jgi:uncharacterized protein (DUF2384 family)